MYRKALVGGRELYFVHAPPQSHLDQLKQKLPKAPHAAVPHHERSVYYYWWAFLRLNKHYIKCCEDGGRGPFAKLYHSFGDVRDGQRPLDEYGEFKAWWVERGAALFCEPRQKDYVEALPQEHQPIDRDRFTVLCVPLQADLDMTMKAIRTVLQPRFERYRDQFGHFSQAKHRVIGNTSLSRLQTILNIRCIKTADPKRSDHLIADDVRIQINRKFENITNLEKHKADRVREHLEAAKALIHNVGQGRFPDFTIPGAERPRPKAKKKEIDWDNL